MATLADLYSTIDTGKRRMKSFLQSPLESMALGVTRFGEDQNSIQNLQANAYPMRGDRTVLNSPQQIGQFRNELADKAVDQAMAAATVWHGSPHKFDKFDGSKIGTGEGAQAYGHGLYLADQKAVADEYAGKLSKSIVDFKNKAPSDEFEIALQKSYQELADRTQLGSKWTTIYDVWNNHANPVNDFLYGNSYAGVKPMSQEKLAMALARRDAANRLGPPVLSDTGSLYKVDLPDEHIAKMLDWDKPLSQQAPEVQWAAAKLGITDAKNGEDLLWKIKRTKFDVREAMQGNTGINNAGAFASEQLKSQGIPGIRYLDGGSRDTGKGSSNYVVFPGNENLLQILERNGVSLKK